MAVVPGIRRVCSRASRSGRAAPAIRGMAALAAVAATSLTAIAHPPLALDQHAPEPAGDVRGFDAPVYILDPITPSGIGLHVNMPSILGEPDGWHSFRLTVSLARQLGFYLMLNNIPGPRDGGLIAQTFDEWSYDDIVRLVSILAGSRVPILLYVGPVENISDPVAVPPERFVKWRDDVAWISQITGAPAGLIIDGSSLYTPGSAPDGTNRFTWFSMFAQAVAPLNIEVGFEAFRRFPNGTPYEDRRHYALLKFITNRYATLPVGADADARIMSAVDAIPPTVNQFRNTVWLDNATWEELADGDEVPAEWLDAWGVTPDELQTAVANRLYAKGYGVIFPRNVLD